MTILLILSLPKMKVRDQENVLKCYTHNTHVGNPVHSFGMGK